MKARKVKLSELKRGFAYNKARAILKYNKEYKLNLNGEELIITL